MTPLYLRKVACFIYLILSALTYSGAMTKVHNAWYSRSSATGLLLYGALVCGKWPLMHNVTCIYTEVSFTVIYNVMYACMYTKGSLTLEKFGT